LSAKRLELLKEAVPTLSRIAVLWNAADPGMVLRFREIEAAARVLDVTLQSLEVRSSEDFERAFTAMTQERPDAFFVVAEVLTLSHRCQVLDFAARNRLPAMYEFGVFARDGGLMAYGPKLTESFQRGAHYVDRVLKGSRPADLPIEQPMNFELVVNFKAAEALNLTLPPHLLLLAERGDRGQRIGVDASGEACQYPLEHWLEINCIELFTGQVMQRHGQDVAGAVEAYRTEEL
jgi:putative ABC transport system substrate-binding protein